MKKTYLERAKAWIDADIDVTVETIQSAIERLHLKVKEIRSGRDVDQDVIEDLNATIDYLNEELQLRIDDENLIEPVNLPASKQIGPTLAEPEEYQFDSSPLADYSDAPQYISASDRAKALEQVKKIPGLLSAGNFKFKNKENERERDCA